MKESVFIYFPHASPLQRDDLEDAIEEFLAGRGEVTGGGSGIDGSNIDIAIDDDTDAEAVLAALTLLLTRLGLPAGTRITRPSKGTQREIT